MYRNGSKTACPMNEIERFMLYRDLNSHTTYTKPYAEVLTKANMK